MHDTQLTVADLGDELERLRCAGDALARAAAAVAREREDPDPALRELCDAILSWRAARSFQGA